MFRPVSTIALVLGSAAPAAELTWASTTETTVSDRGDLVEAANFGNANTTTPTVNGVPFAAVDFTSRGSPTKLAGLTYNTRENGHRAGTGIAGLLDTIAYGSGANPQTASLTGLTPANG